MHCFRGSLPVTEISLFFKIIGFLQKLQNFPETYHCGPSQLIFDACSLTLNQLKFSSILGTLRIPLPAVFDFPSQTFVITNIGKHGTRAITDSDTLLGSYVASVFWHKCHNFPRGVSAN